MFNSNSNSSSDRSSFSGLMSSSPSRGSGITDFMNSNSLVAKVAFLLLVLLCFIVITRITISALTWMLGSSTSRSHIFDGMVPGDQMIIIPQDTTLPGANQISRSVNGVDGIEFTWSVWIYINNLDTNVGKYKHIFHKGNSDIDSSTGKNFPNNAPGLYISPNTNELTVVMNTFDVPIEEILVPDIPLNKWINIMIRCRNTDLDVYINGTITKSAQLTGVPKQNYGEVYVAMNGGFPGYISNLWYYNYALGTSAIQSLVKAGPNITTVGNSSMNMKNPNYLSLRWYFYGNQDGYNS